MAGREGQRIDHGGVSVAALALGTFTAPFEVLIGMSPDEAKEFLTQRGHPADGVIHGYAFAIRSGARTVLVDAGMGHGSMLPGLPASLETEGIAGADVDTVLLTHLHPDHANGLLDGSFPAASIVVPDDEIAFVRDPAALGATSPYVQHDYERAADVLDAIGTRLVPLSEWDDDLVAPEPLPGHSAGHTGYRLLAGEQEVLFVGDLLHLPHLQAPRPDISVLPDLDPAQAAITRERVLARCEADGTVLAGAHLGERGLRQVRVADPGYELV